MTAPINRTTKAIGVFLTGLTSWSAMFLPPIVAGGIAVLTAAAIVWLVPNAPSEEGEPPVLRIGHIDSGQASVGGLVLLAIGFILGVLCTKAGIFGTS